MPAAATRLSSAKSSATWSCASPGASLSRMFKIEELAGVLPALASPLKRDGTVDEPGVTRLVEHVLDGGVSGLVPLGSTGETASLDETSRRSLLGSVVKAARG